MYSLSDLLLPIINEDRRFGVTVGIVTNNQDPQGTARVKVKFPWLGDSDESFWARIVSPMAGNNRGLFLLPEIDDEVLVAFEHGAMDHAYILGSLWNGSDHPPETNSDGKNNVRFLKSRSGHLIRLDDTENASKIEIIDSTGKNKITIDSSANTVEIESEADIKLHSNTGKISLSAVGIELKSQADISLEATGNAELKAGGEMNVKGSLVNLN